MRSKKRCPICDKTKLASEFPRNRSSWDGLAAYCKPCHNQKMRENKQKLYGGEASFLLKLRYGITIEDKERMIQAQGGLCLICGEKPAKHVDHDHVTGKVRGILCFSCNRGLGKFKDDPSLLERAITYLGSTL